MQNYLIYIVLIILLPVSLVLIFLEKRARRVILSFICGILVCFSAYYINNLVYRTTSMGGNLYTYTFAPLVEETLKFIPLLLISLILRKGKRQTIAMSFALGVGFCVIENFYYLISNINTANIAWIIVRCIGTGLMHSMSSTFIGFGLYKARTDEKKYGVLIAIVALLIAVSYHTLYNFCVASRNIIKIVGVFIPIISYTIISILLKKDAIKAFFDDDIIKEKTEK